MATNWAFQTPEVALQEAFAIAMDYLESVEGQEPSVETQRESALIIIDEWQKGKRHRIWMANKAIVAAEEKPDNEQQAQLFRPHDRSVPDKMRDHMNQNSRNQIAEASTLLKQAREMVTQVLSGETATIENTADPVLGRQTGQRINESAYTLLECLESLDAALAFLNPAAD